MMFGAPFRLRGRQACPLNRLVSVQDILMIETPHEIR